MMTKDKKNFGIIRNVLNLHPLCLLKGRSYKLRK